jgi:hypothetical protein
MELHQNPSKTIPIEGMRLAKLDSSQLTRGTARPVHNWNVQHSLLAFHVIHQRIGQTFARYPERWGKRPGSGDKSPMHEKVTCNSHALAEGVSPQLVEKSSH